MSDEHIYWVSFRQPPLPGDERTEFFFHSLSAIYEMFTADQVGCKVARLWNIGVSKGTPYVGKLCTVCRASIQRKAQKRPNSADKSECVNLQQEEKKTPHTANSR
jgi:hypothetical protein